MFDSFSLKAVSITFIDRNRLAKELRNKVYTFFKTGKD
jgi:hypothetical protein